MSADDSEPARKRARLMDGGSLQSMEDLARDDVFWLEDGNIVLITGKVAFKVYRGLLAAQSPVFADMFTTATPDSNQMLDGCAVVHLSDSPEDMRHFLGALVPKSQRLIYTSADEKPFTFMQLSALVRLAHKYQIEDVQGQALASLKTYFADNFEDWDDDGPVPFQTPAKRTAGIEVVHLAHLTDSPKLLPFAFYFCTLGGGDVVDGWRREDGTVVRLEADDLKRVVSGYGKLQRMTDSFTSSIFSENPSPKCLSQEQCRSALLHIRMIFPATYPAPRLLHRWRGTIERWRDEFGLCSACSNMLHDNDRKERFKLWNSLPALFELDIDGWESE